MQAPLYDPSTAANGTARGLMAALWRQSLVAYVSNDPAFGTRLPDPDFKLPRTSAGTSGEAVAGWWQEDSAAGGTSEAFSSTAGADGIATASATTGTDHFGIEVHYGDAATTLGTVALPTHTTSSARRGRVVYQSRVDIGTTGTGAGVLDTFFFGLTEAIGTFFSSTSTLPTDSDYIGFTRLDGGSYKFSMANDNNAGTAVTDDITIPSGIIQEGWNNFGFAVNVDGSVEVVINGIPLISLSKTLSSLALPIEYLTPRFASTRGATGDRASVSIPVDFCEVFVAPA